MERWARENPRFEAIDAAIREQGWKVVALLRLSPLVPFSLSNYLYGLTAVRFWPYVAASAAGMIGHRLEVDTTIVSGQATSLNNMLRRVERVGIGIDDLVLQPLAAGEAVLTDAERDLGVVLLDIGGGTTDIAVFQEGSLAFAAILPIGGSHITNDIAMGLRTPFAAAEEVKLRHGYALPDLIEEERTIEVAAFERDEGRTVSMRLLGEIIQDRLEETFDLVRQQLGRGGYEGGLPAGIVLAGGTAQLRGIRMTSPAVLASKGHFPVRSS